jgi:hypothetical protein
MKSGSRTLCSFAHNARRRVSVPVTMPTAWKTCTSARLAQRIGNVMGIVLPSPVRYKKDDQAFGDAEIANASEFLDTLREFEMVIAVELGREDVSKHSGSAFGAHG